MNTSFFNNLSETKLRDSKQLNSSHLFHLENLSVQFGKVTALNSIQMTINKGEILFITGASGAGKTTLLNILANDIRPTKGKVLYPSRNIFVSQIFQDLRLMNNKTCEENLKVSYDQSVYDSYDEFSADLQQLCKLLGVWEYRKTLIKNANGGLKQKVAMIRALLARPDVVLADEPTSALDKDNAVKLFEVLNF